MLSEFYFNIFGDASYKSLAIKVAIAVVIFIAFKITSMIFKKKAQVLVTKIFKIKDKRFEETLIGSILKPFSAFLLASGTYLALITIPFSDPAIYTFFMKYYRIAIIIIVSVFFQNFIGNITVFIKILSDEKNKALIHFFTKMGKILVIVFTVSIILKEFGIEVTGLVAGLGLGGLTIALAAQDTASNFCSGLVLLFDKPFDLGEWITIAGQEGVVEEMNFRSCRIRTFDNAVITIPNSKISSDSVTNWTKMNMRKTKFTIGLTYCTTKETLQKVCDEIKEYLNTRDDLKNDTILVWFDSFNSSSLDINVQYHSYPLELPLHVALREEVHFAVMDIITANDTDFAFDTKTIITN